MAPKCLPCGMDPVTVRRPLIVHDSTFDYRPTSWPGMLLNSQDKKVRYQLINYERPSTIVLQRWRVTRHSLQSSSSYPVMHTSRRLAAFLFQNAVLAVGQPPKPIAAFDKATIAVGHHGPNCVKTY
ncbi:jg7091 [Pararge aegeria aegeria]|uniref:Jg7091 protein n=1 Tax=Pararge aegeria aegeria TaxID=348720 RepID=A0A8S4R067_9NEOP|nr:jg7091 [Pararge aegeria aegeria]